MHKNYKIMLSVPCAYGFESPSVRNWTTLTTIDMMRDPRFTLLDGGGLELHTPQVHRIHCARNTSARQALESNCDFLLMCDPDMQPDARLFNDRLPADRQPEAREWAKPFVFSSLDFMLSTCSAIVAAPAVGAPPENKINVWPARDGGELKRMSHQEMAEIEPGFQRVAAVGTGLMLVDCNLFRNMPQPWFEDAYQPDQVDPETGAVIRDPQFDVTRSQDTNFCIKADAMRARTYVNHFAPAGHIKPKSWLPPACKDLGHAPSPAHA